MLKKNTICIYCGSSSDTPESHKIAAETLGSILALNNLTLVFGGGAAGLMGHTANSALRSGGEVIGVIPEFLIRRKVGHNTCTKLFVTQTMHERKQKMAELSDAFVVLPGGLGTLDEAFEIMTWKQLKLHNKPIIFVSIDGYWDDLVNLFKIMKRQNYVENSDTKLFTIVTSIDDVLPTIKML